MMYKKNVVACIKVGGEILREQSDRVTLPFGSEYSILLKNLESVRVQAKVQIDGQNAAGDTWLVIEPNGSLEIERFIRNGNFDKGNRFKFIERTKPIESARGVKIDDGLVRIEFKKEFVAPQIVTNIVRTKYVYDWDWDYWPYRPYRPYRPYCGNYTQSSMNSQSFQQAHQNMQKSASGSPVRCMAMNMQTPNEAGITVPGSESNQKFIQAQSFATESQSEIIVLHLIGTNQKAVRVQKPVTISTKPKCSTCHKVNKGGSKFCSQCGTALELI